MAYKNREDALAYAREYKLKKHEEWGSGQIWFVYYIPDSHYCGITNNPWRRMAEHRGKREGCKNVTDWKLLYSTEDLEEAARVEAEFHLMGMEGANWGKNYR